jgi:hypothetical protein
MEEGNENQKPKKTNSEQKISILKERMNSLKEKNEALKSKVAKQEEADNQPLSQLNFDLQGEKMELQSKIA